VLFFTEIENIKKKASRKFHLRELSGAFGDWGTLIPFIIGYISIVKLNPAGIFICLGITNIALGLRYNLPLPVQPQKTIGSIALAQKWSANRVISTGFMTGIIWLILGISKFLNKITKKVPKITVRGIQLGLAFILGWSAVLMFINDYILGIISLAIILVFIRIKKVPTAVLLIIFGIFVMVYTGLLTPNVLVFNIPIFNFQLPTLENMLIGFLIAGIGQILLTLTNVMIATIALIKDLFPEQESGIDPSNLALNMGVINIISPFLGGIPLCHGSGGLAAQYAFGARTGGSMIFEGGLEIILGLFFSDLLLNVFIFFPVGILASMLIYTAFTLGKVSLEKLKDWKLLLIILVSAFVCFFINITVGFIVGLIMYFIWKKIKNRKPRDNSE
jgi:MFS superfamily sulfate permease-like transporter